MDKQLSDKTDIEINGKIYYITDNLSNRINTITPIENIKLYKYLIALVMDSYSNKKLTKLTKNGYEQLLQTVEKLYSYIITGKVNECNLSLMEQTIVNKIPSLFIPSINPHLIEVIDL